MSQAQCSVGSSHQEHAKNIAKLTAAFEPKLQAFLATVKNNKLLPLDCLNEIPTSSIWSLLIMVGFLNIINDNSSETATQQAEKKDLTSVI
eukprot:CAMPEP_0173466774 /NCGR_PEP_ID=MMETSP1357-20121228/73926_1 /TAXON_ID=77926 /ORGANISM="Hemiselmis rufescens, Strain PCC563" /LENGTH=90 /DNA_ID=CAMNT_0014434859 /DNA_START=34 /DNA_END=303 /DNA_ORIENTATION=-